MSGLPDWPTDDRNAFYGGKPEDRRATWNALTDDQKWDYFTQVFDESRNKSRSIHDLQEVVEMIPNRDRYSGYGDRFTAQKDWITAAKYIIGRVFDGRWDKS